MGTHEEFDYEIVYLNSDGTYVSGFKAEQDAPQFREYPNGNLVPACFFEG